MRKYLSFAVLLTVITFMGCQENTTVQPVDNSGTSMNKWWKDVPKEVQAELLSVRAATAKYHHDTLKAVADGYIDLKVYVPGMGHHFGKVTEIDGTFEAANPEILVYQELPNGDYHLVAVEYAAPLSLPNPPAGFTGNYDVWVQNTGAGIWALHAWIWEYNPSGVFVGINPNLL